MVLGGDGFITHEGTFENGNITHGIFRNPDGSGEIYDGEWKTVGSNNIPTGKGIKTRFSTAKNGDILKVITKCDFFADGHPTGFAEEAICNETDNTAFITKGEL